MQGFFLGSVIGFLVSLGLTKIMIPVAKRFGLVDDPKTHKHPGIVHTGIIPRAGGVPIFLGLLVTYFLLTQQVTHQIVGIFLGAIVLVIVGLFDDRWDISPYIRFIINIIVALCVVGFGVGINAITNPLGGIISLTDWKITFDLFGTPHSIVVLADIVAMLWIVWMMNAINWSSGVDGQLSGIVVIGAIVLGIVAWRFASQDANQLPVIYLATATAIAFLGFLPFSFYPQKIMPGYSGAALGGYLLAVLAILSGARLATALIVLGVPMADGALAMIRRLSRKQSPFRGDREHLHHHLLVRGWSKRKIALFYWGTCAMLGLTALQLDSRGKLFALILIAAVFGGITYWIYWTSKRLDDRR